MRGHGAGFHPAPIKRCMNIKSASPLVLQLDPRDLRVPKTLSVSMT
jgi:hypothetical protein